MELYTLDREFIRQDTIDAFESAIWTERYKGDGDFKLVVPKTDETMEMLYAGRLMACEGSIQPMMLETREIKDGLIEATGIALTPWLNNRFIRTTADHTIKEWSITNKPGQIISAIAQQMVMPSNYNNGTINIGIPVGITSLFPIPGLVAGAIDTTGDVVTIAVPFGPVYDPIKEIADTYDIGVKIELQDADEDGYTLIFVTYTGTNRTSDQSVNPVIRFSEEMDTFNNVKDLDSISDHKNYFFMFAPGAPTTYALGPALLDGSTGQTGFDLRTFESFVDSIPDTATTDALIHSYLFEQGKKEWNAHRVVQIVDGEMVQTGQIEYGTDYFLGDIIEVEGNSGVLQNARITEYIRSQDSAGSRNYPTLTMMDSLVPFPGD
jgi:hypothetical protein